MTVLPSNVDTAVTANEIRELALHALNETGLQPEAVFCRFLSPARVRDTDDGTTYFLDAGSQVAVYVVFRDEFSGIPENCSTRNFSLSMRSSAGKPLKFHFVFYYLDLRRFAAGLPCEPGEDIFPVHTLWGNAKV